MRLNPAGDVDCVRSNGLHSLRDVLWREPSREDHPQPGMLPHELRRKGEINQLSGTSKGPRNKSVQQYRPGLESLALCQGTTIPGRHRLDKPVPRETATKHRRFISVELDEINPRKFKNRHRLLPGRIDQDGHPHYQRWQLRNPFGRGPKVQITLGTGKAVETKGVRSGIDGSFGVLRIGDPTNFDPHIGGTRLWS